MKSPCLPKVTLLATLILAIYGIPKKVDAQEMNVPQEQSAMDNRFVAGPSAPVAAGGTDTFSKSGNLPNAVVDVSVPGDRISQLPIPVQIDQPIQEKDLPLNDLPHLGVQVSPKEPVVQRMLSALPLAGVLPEEGHIEVKLEKQQAIANGNSGLRLKILLFDQSGHPVRVPVRVRLETTLGKFRLANGHEGSITDTVIRNGMQIGQLISSSVPGIARITIRSGAVSASGNVNFLPEQGKLIALGIVDVSHSVGRSDHDRDAASVINPGFEDNFLDWSDGDGSTYTLFSNRIAGFVKGTVLNNTVLTASYDNQKINNNKFFADIDPNEYYPNYGDTSVITYDARSTGKLYARLDQGKDYLMYGDYLTHDASMPDRLGTYVRTLNGGKGYLETDNAKVLAFIARTGYTKQVNEQPALGVSGPYSVTNATQAVLNSEQVTLVTRDRFQPSIVLRTQPMGRYVDYDFEPFSGRIIFRKPVPSVDENLNPVSIRIVYEVDDFHRNEHWVGGVDGAYRIGSMLTLEGRYAKDQNPLVPNDIKGATAQIDLGPKTRVVADFAHSNGSETLPDLNQLGNNISAVPNLENLSGNAKSIVFTHDGSNLTAKLLAMKVDEGFDNPSANVTPGRTDEAGKLAYKLTETTTLVASGRHTTDDITDGFQTAVSAGVRQQFTPGFRVEAGVNHINENYTSFLGGGIGIFGSRTVPGSGRVLDPNSNGNNLLFDPSILQCTGVANCAVVNNYTSAYLDAKYQVTPAWWLNGLVEQAISGDNGHRVSVGTEYTLASLGGRAYGRYEWTDALSQGYGLGDHLGSNKGAVVGVDTAYMKGGNVFGEYRLGGISADDSTIASGVRNTFQLSPHLIATASLEHQIFHSEASGTQAANAVTTGLDYVGNPLWRAGGKLEYRISETQQDWLSTIQVTRKLNQSWSLLTRNVLLKTRPMDDAGALKTDQDRFQTGLAYRDMNTNRLNALLRYEHNIDVSGVINDRTDSRNDVLAAGANYHVSPDWTYSASTAFKAQTDRFIGAPEDSFHATLISGRLMHDISDHWDVGVLASHTWGGGARDSGAGVEVGYRLMKNLWLSSGYVAGRYADDEMFAANSSWHAMYVRLRFKFDEGTFGLDKQPAAPVFTPVTMLEKPIEPVPVPLASAPLIRQELPRFEKVTLSSTQLFDFDSAQLHLPQPKLDEIATLLVANRQINHIVISGYSDRIGSERTNRNISQRRAEMVKAYLVTRGVAAERLTAVGQGSDHPVVKCANRNREALIACLAPNRRVEVEQVTVERPVHSVKRGI